MLIARGLFTLVLLLTTLIAVADGSKDFYPSGVAGNRAFLISARGEDSLLLNLGEHFVFVKAGERVAVASSAQNIGSGRIRLTSPNNNTIYTSTSNDIGRIMARSGMNTREAELAGPEIGYTPFYGPIVTLADEGIWKVEFLPPTARDRYWNENAPDVQADDPWTQSTDGNQIAAWDISVKGVDGSWIKGRVYAAVLNLHVSTETLHKKDGAFYGRNYVLTKDGYVYAVDGNGSHGLRFSYFVNSSGILTQSGESSYKSSDKGYDALFHNPNRSDAGIHVTHKMFYSFPDLTMPAESRGAVPGGRTWLSQAITSVVPEVHNITLWGVEGNPNYISKKGSIIQFESNTAARYRITIESSDNNFYFPTRHIIVNGVSGVNRYVWDGLDGAGGLLPVGKNYPVEISISSVEGEIHFPYFDMEINPSGILIKRMNSDQTFNSYATVYWDDSEIPLGLVQERSSPLQMLTGISSAINGHKWGTYSESSRGDNNRGNLGTGSYSFGNNMAMDTWSYTVFAAEKSTFPVTVEVVDLEVIRVEANKTIIELDEDVVYTVEVKNNGPSDAIGSAFEFSLPEGFAITDVTPSSTCGLLIGLRTVGNKLFSNMNLPNQCGMIITIRTKANNVPDATYGVVQATTGVVRPADFTDPDATSANYNMTSPGRADVECSAGCNNIKVNTQVFLLEPFEERGQLALLKTVRHIDADGSGFQEKGELLEYTFTIRNVGMVLVDEIYIVDNMLSSKPITPINSSSSLDVGEEMVIVYNYSITDEDLNRKQVINSAAVIGRNPRRFEVKDVSGTDFTNDVPTSIVVEKAPYFRMRKTIVNKGSGENGQFTLGDKIRYRFEVRHGGDIAVDNIGLEDRMLFTNSTTMGFNTIDNATLTYESEYTVTLADIDNGSVSNTAVVRGKDMKYGRAVSDISGITFDDDKSTIIAMAKRPVAYADKFQVYQRMPAVLQILDNDIMGSSTIRGTGIRIIQQPALGKITISNGRLTYTSSGTNHGDDYFTYSVLDGSRLHSNTVRVDISILKTIPMALNDNYTVGLNYEVKMNLFANDYVHYAELDHYSIQIVTHPSNGTVFRGEGSTYIYQPNTNFTGYDSFEYTINDNNGNTSAPATVYLESLGFILPNTITPNGDGLNDTFVILGSYLFEVMELEVIDRFGNLVFQSSNYNNDWMVDPKIKEGTYYYIFKGRKNGYPLVVRRGSLLLFRGNMR